MIEVLLADDAYDEAFAKNWCHGFDELESYVQHFPPEVVEAVTGVPAATVRELARRIGSASRCSLVTYTGLEYSNSGVQALRAVFTLWALVGQLDVHGGIGLAMRGTRFPTNRSGHVENPHLERTVARDLFPVHRDSSNYLRAPSRAFS